MPQMVQRTAERNVHTYSELWHTSNCLLEMAEKVEEGSYHLIMGSLVFRAFSLEAFLNHIGQHLFSSWQDLEKLSPKSKLNVLAEHVELEIDYGREPWQIVKELFGFRNDIAHGKTIALNREDVVTLEAAEKDLFGALGLETEWEKYCTINNAQRASELVREIMTRFHELAAIPDDMLFDFGFASGGSTLIQQYK